MAKNRNKKKKNESGPKAMDVTLDNHTVTDIPQAMDTSETVAPKAFAGGQLRTQPLQKNWDFSSRQLSFLVLSFGTIMFWFFSTFFPGDPEHD